MLRRLVAERQIKLGAYKKMKKHIENYDVFKETISQNNVLAMAEQLAMYETRFLIGYMGSRMQKIYADLCVDIRRKTILTTRSVTVMIYSRMRIIPL